jgi:hypothetical protein
LDTLNKNGWQIASHFCLNIIEEKEGIHYKSDDFDSYF